MNLLHAKIKLDILHVAHDLPPIQAGLFGAAKVEFENIPDDATDIRAVISNPRGERFEVAITNGILKIAPGLLTKSGIGSYHILATDADGNTTPLGWGHIVVASYPSTGTPADESVTVSTVLDSNGVRHELKAEKDEFGEWSLVVGDEIV